MEGKRLGEAARECCGYREVGKDEGERESTKIHYVLKHHQDS